MLRAVKSGLGTMGESIDPKDHHFWDWLRVYLPLFRRFNEISKGAQEMTLPTGSSVIYWTWKLLEFTSPQHIDNQVLVNVKATFHTSFSNRLGKYLQELS